MRQDTYKGESLGKAVARFLFWSDAIRSTKGVGSFIFLAGREGRDVRTLRGLGISDAAMVAVERVRSAQDSFTALFPTIKLLRSKVTDAVRKSGSVAVCYLDYCGPLSRAVFEDVREVSALMPIGSILGVNVLKGRDQSWAADRVQALRDRALARHHMRLRRTIEYRSRTADGPGVPMITFSFGPPKWGGETRRLQVPDNLSQLRRFIDQACEFFGATAREIYAQ